jgi:hypothetical protein
MIRQSRPDTVDVAQTVKSNISQKPFICFRGRLKRNNLSGRTDARCRDQCEQANVGSDVDKNVTGPEKVIHKVPLGHFKVPAVNQPAKLTVPIESDAEIWLQLRNEGASLARNGGPPALTPVLLASPPKELQAIG